MGADPILFGTAFGCVVFRRHSSSVLMGVPFFEFLEQADVSLLYDRCTSRQYFR